MGPALSESINQSLGCCNFRALAVRCKKTSLWKALQWSGGSGETEGNLKEKPKGSRPFRRFHSYHKGLPECSAGVRLSVTPGSLFASPGPWNTHIFVGSGTSLKLGGVLVGTSSSEQVLQASSLLPFKPKRSSSTRRTHLSHNQNLGG